MCYIYKLGENSSMKPDLMIKIEVNKSNDSEYLVKDMSNITIGRFNIVEMNDLNKRCDIRLRFYKITLNFN